MYTNTLEITKNADALQQLFEMEDKEFPNKRAKYEVQLSQKKLIITITAKDTTALKNMITSIIKIISIYERTREVLK